MPLRLDRHKLFNQLKKIYHGNIPDVLKDLKKGKETGKYVLGDELLKLYYVTKTECESTENCKAIWTDAHSNHIAIFRELDEKIFNKHKKKDDYGRLAKSLFFCNHLVALKEAVKETINIFPGKTEIDIYEYFLEFKDDPDLKEESPNFKRVSSVFLILQHHHSASLDDWYKKLLALESPKEIREWCQAIEMFYTCEKPYARTWFSKNTTSLVEKYKPDELILFLDLANSLVVSEEIKEKLLNSIVEFPHLKKLNTVIELFKLLKDKELYAILTEKNIELLLCHDVLTNFLIKIIGLVSSSLENSNELLINIIQQLHILFNDLDANSQEIKEKIGQCILLENIDLKKLELLLNNNAWSADLIGKIVKAKANFLHLKSTLSNGEILESIVEIENSIFSMNSIDAAQMLSIIQLFINDKIEKKDLYYCKQVIELLKKENRKNLSDTFQKYLQTAIFKYSPNNKPIRAQCLEFLNRNNQENSNHMLDILEKFNAASLPIKKRCQKILERLFEDEQLFEKILEQDMSPEDIQKEILGASKYQSFSNVVPLGIKSLPETHPTPSSPIHEVSHLTISYNQDLTRYYEQLNTCVDACLKASREDKEKFIKPMHELLKTGKPLVKQFDARAIWVTLKALVYLKAKGKQHQQHIGLLDDLLIIIKQMIKQFNFSMISQVVFCLNRFFDNQQIEKHKELLTELLIAAEQASPQQYRATEISSLLMIMSRLLELDQKTKQYRELMNAFIAIIVRNMEKFANEDENENVAIVLCDLIFVLSDNQKIEGSEHLLYFLKLMEQKIPELDIKRINRILQTFIERCNRAGHEELITKILMAAGQQAHKLDSAKDSILLLRNLSVFLTNDQKIQMHQELISATIIYIEKNIEELDTQEIAIIFICVNPVFMKIERFNDLINRLLIIMREKKIGSDISCIISILCALKDCLLDSQKVQEHYLLINKLLVGIKKQIGKIKTLSDIGLILNALAYLSIDDQWKEQFQELANILIKKIEQAKEEWHADSILTILEVLPRVLSTQNIKKNQNLINTLLEAAEQKFKDPKNTNKYIPEWIDASNQLLFSGLLNYKNRARTEMLLNAIESFYAVSRIIETVCSDTKQVTFTSLFTTTRAETEKDFQDNKRVTAAN